MSLTPLAAAPGGPQSMYWFLSVPAESSVLAVLAVLLGLCC